jgi:hypothetical protein
LDIQELGGSPFSKQIAKLLNMKGPYEKPFPSLDHIAANIPMIHAPDLLHIIGKNVPEP